MFYLSVGGDLKFFYVFFSLTILSTVNLTHVVKIY